MAPPHPGTCGCWVTAPGVLCRLGAAGAGSRDTVSPLSRIHKLCHAALGLHDLLRVSAVHSLTTLGTVP